MHFSKLGKSDILISKIGLGTNAVGGHNLFTNLDENQGRQMIEEALDQGITFIDTADVYGFGRSEEIIGEVLGSRRNDVVLATKGAIERLEDGSTRINNKPTYLRRALEASLKRLRTDYVDLYYIHWLDNETPLAEAVGELIRLKEEGKIRAIGISNANLEQLQEANQSGDISALQSPYHMLDRSAEKDLLPYCIEHHISFIPYGPLAFGILGGKYTSGLVLEEGDWRKNEPLFQPDTFRSNLDKVEKLKMVAAEINAALPNLALAWLLAQSGVDAVIPGGKRPEQVKENIKANGIVLSDEQLKRIHHILG
jgi:myo-inositol catabolism protein IolS